jgi:2-hydroxy-3-keto-5-methylthiopentenyl-1-phosphate phosphatase
MDGLTMKYTVEEMEALSASDLSGMIEFKQLVEKVLEVVEEHKTNALYVDYLLDEKHLTATFRAAHGDMFGHIDNEFVEFKVEKDDLEWFGAKSAGISILQELVDKLGDYMFIKGD